MGHRVARLDELGPPSGAARTAGFDELGTGPSDEIGRSTGEIADEAVAGPAVAPVAELGAVDGQRAAGPPLARLDRAAARPHPHPHQEAELYEATPYEPAPRGRDGRAIDQQRSRPARAGGSVGEGRRRGAPPGSAGGGAQPDVGARAAPAVTRRGGPKQVDPDADPVAAAREICLRLLTDRARTRHELAQALRRRGVPDDAAGTVLERFDEVGLIDDAAFAGQWVRSRQRSRGLARRAIAMELRRKGVDDETAGDALAEVDDESEARRARELVDRKLRSLTVDSPERRAVAARRLVGMLARKGYGGGVAYGVVRDALAAHGAESDELGEAPADG